MNDFQSKYLTEVSQRLKYEGLTVLPEYSGLLPIEKDAHRLCSVNIHGGISYDPDHVRMSRLEEALELVRDKVKETWTYMRQMEDAPPLQVEGVSGEYRLLAEFNDIVLAGHPTQFGMQFITWTRLHDRSLRQGNYFDPGSEPSAYTAAKQDFAARSGLLPASRIFTNEQLAVIFDAAQHMTVHGLVSNPEQEKLLEQIVEQIEESVPEVIDLANELTQYPKQTEQGMQIY